MIRRQLFAFALLCFFTNGANAQKTALLIIDIQDFYFPGGKTELVEPEKAAENAKTILFAFRQKGKSVVHVRHIFEPGGNFNKRVEPIEGEQIFSKKAVNSFVGTELKAYLDSLGVTELVICGMQTHMCVEAAVRAAVDFGYNVTLIDDACATRNLKWNDIEIPAQMVHAATLSTLKSYCKIVSTSNFLEEIQL